MHGGKFIKILSGLKHFQSNPSWCRVAGRRWIYLIIISFLLFSDSPPDPTLIILIIRWIISFLLFSDSPPDPTLIIYQVARRRYKRSVSIMLPDHPTTILEPPSSTTPRLKLRSKSMDHQIKPAPELMSSTTINIDQHLRGGVGNDRKNDQRLNPEDQRGEDRAPLIGDPSQLSTAILPKN